MTLQDPIYLTGVPGSPYTRKMLAVLRYRHIPYRFLIGRRGEDSGLPQPKVHLVPIFYLPDEHGTLQAVVDSTPIIRRLESERPGRSIIPDDPVVAFLNSLLEDYADEWLTKAMFHYRWYYQADIDKAAQILPRWHGISAQENTVAEMSKVFSERQISRLYVVGSNPVTAPVIEASYERFLAAFAKHLEAMPFLMGARPGSADFGVYGQLTQLVQFDPTPMAVTLDKAPRVYAWVDIIDDLSGLDAGQSSWIKRDAIPATLIAILKEAGRTYVPVMLANADALARGAEKVETTVDGNPWVQTPFPYQAKCLQWLREEYAKLRPGDRTFVDNLLVDTGYRDFLEG